MYHSYHQKVTLSSFLLFAVRWVQFNLIPFFVRYVFYLLLVALVTVRRRMDLFMATRGACPVVSGAWCFGGVLDRMPAPTFHGRDPNSVIQVQNLKQCLLAAVGSTTLLWTGDGCGAVLMGKYRSGKILSTLLRCSAVRFDY